MGASRQQRWDSHLLLAPSKTWWTINVCADGQLQVDPNDAEAAMVRAKAKADTEAFIKLHGAKFATKEDPAASKPAATKEPEPAPVAGKGQRNPAAAAGGSGKGPA